MTLGFISTPGPMEMLVIGVIAVLLFGKRLPEVGRSVGKGILEFKKQLQGIENELHGAMSAVTSTSNNSTATASPAANDREEATAPKFEPPPAEGSPAAGSIAEASPATGSPAEGSKETSQA